VHGSSELVLLRHSPCGCDPEDAWELATCAAGACRQQVSLGLGTPEDPEGLQQLLTRRRDRRASGDRLAVTVAEGRDCKDRYRERHHDGDGSHHATTAEKRHSAPREWLKRPVLTQASQHRFDRQRRQFARIRVRATNQFHGWIAHGNTSAFTEPCSSSR